MKSQEKKKKFNRYSIEEQIKKYGITFEEATKKINDLKSKVGKFNIYSVQDQMSKYNLTMEEALLKIEKIKNVNVFSLEWQMNKFGITEKEAIDKIEKIKNECRKTQLSKSEFDFNSMIPSKKEHWIKKGYSEEESKNMAENNINVAIVNCRIYSNSVKNNPELYKDKRTTNIEYWLKKGFTEEESKSKVKERQNTFSLDKCITRYGNNMGIKVYTDRQNKWQNSLLYNGNLKYGYSAISQELFNDIIKQYKNLTELEMVYFATKNNEYKLNKINGGIWLFDFTDLNKMKIIEFNGDIYHANPSKYVLADTPNPFKKYLTAEQIWQKDAEKIKVANDKGFEVLTIWDSEYIKDKQATLEKCLEFLFS
jgi:hypothetical protein